MELLKFIADGEIPDDSAKVIIQVGTSDPKIDSIIVTLTIEPSPLSVSINPPNISAGETAEIILTYKYSDGTTEVLTPGLYSYQITILEGCSLGQLLVNGQRDQYFYDVDLPMYFVADSLASGIATIKVGIIEDGGSAGKIKANNNIKSLPNAIQSCTGFDFDVTKKDVGEVIIGDGCENISEEHSEIIYNVVERNEYYPVSIYDKGEYLWLSEMVLVCDDPRKPAGSSKAIEYKRYKYDYSTNSFINSWKLKPYKVEDKVHYFFVNPHDNNPIPLVFDYITGVCYANINPLVPPPNHIQKTLIENIDEINVIPADDAEQAFEDFCGFNCYPNELYKYYLIEIIRIHEREHMADYEAVISRLFPSLVNEIKDYKDRCENYDVIHRLNAEKVVYDMICRFIQKVNKEFEKFSGLKDSSNPNAELDHERLIQSRDSIKNRIIDYTSRLKKRFPHKLFGKHCSKCSYQ